MNFLVELRIARRLRTALLIFAVSLSAIPALAQVQECPANINFSSGDISVWSAKTGLVKGATKDYPAPNNGVSVIPEYSIETTGINVITNSFNDKYGGFPTIPTINGYSYGYSVQIGSNATSWDLHTEANQPGGFTRSISYQISVPAGPASTPYTMTYAYAMVLENGTHNSNEQPLFKATLSTAAGIIACASPSYYLPTLNDAVQGNDQGAATGATLDSAGAKANGFKVSGVLFLSHAGRQGNAGQLLQDVWTKSWTEVTFDLSPYRGQTVTLTFESDNCVPGAHFAYAYVALRNNCAGLEISGDPTACTNSAITYSVPALANASYNWTVPPGWSLVGAATSNSITVVPGNAPGIITAHEVNGCADLADTINVKSLPPTVAGRVGNDNSVCAGTNNTSLTLAGQTGSILNWVASTDGVTWTPVTNTTTSYAPQNLLVTTQFKAVVQNGSSCSIDSSTVAIVSVSPKTVAGSLSPDNTDICIGQTSNSAITLTGNTGAVVNWQTSGDGTNWNNFLPIKKDSVYNVTSVPASSWYRTIVKSGVCPADTSSVAKIHLINARFPAAAIDPAISSICYGKTVQLNADITIGTTYTWTNAETLTNAGNGTINSVPYSIHAIAAPLQTGFYILSVTNAGCPNMLMDTFHVAVSPPIRVFAGNDTSIVIAQTLQLNAVSDDPTANQFTWTPTTGLNNSSVFNPIANLGTYGSDFITYIVRATNAKGCYGEDNIKVTIFKTPADIFVPSAFSPNGDGHNDIIRPICVGITKLNFFRVFNRWGQLVFATSEMNKGWDGLIQGAQQPTSNFVYVAQGVDYTGRTILRKGNIVLIR